MKPWMAWLAALNLIVLQHALAADPARPAGSRAAPPAATSSAPTSYSREKNADVCTSAPRSEWLAEDEMQLIARHRGYRIKTFKVANNSCYEIYGFNREGKIVEAYFNPLNARLVRENFAQ